MSECPVPNQLEYLSLTEDTGTLAHAGGALDGMDTRSSECICTEDREGGGSMRMITAYLRFNGFEKKVKMIDVVSVYREIVTLPMTISFLQEAFTPDSSNRHPVLEFEWKKQLSRFTHEYRLKDILK